MLQISRWRSGFTLIELMVVIAILGILVGILYFPVQGYLARGRDTQRLMNIKGYVDTIGSYQRTYETYPDNGTGAIYSYCVSDVFTWPDDTTKADRRYSTVSSNYNLLPMDPLSSAYRPITGAVCSMTGSYFYNRLTDAGGHEYGVLATLMEGVGNTTYTTGADLENSGMILNLINAQKLTGTGVFGLTGSQQPIYHVIIN